MSDIHELLKTIINDENVEEKKETEEFNIETIFGMTLDEFKQIINPTYKKAYLCLDTKNCTFNLDRTKCTWIFQNDKNIFNSSVNAIGDIKNIIQIKIADFFISFGTSTNPIYYDDQMMITVDIPEFNAQSFIGPENANFHFVGTMITNIMRILNMPTYLAKFQQGADNVGALEPYYRIQDGNEGIYVFNTPMNILNTISLVFGCPYQPISLHNDSYALQSYVSQGSNTSIIFRLQNNDIAISKETVTSQCSFPYFNTTNPIADKDIISLLLNPPAPLFATIQRNNVPILNLNVTISFNQYFAYTYTFPYMTGIPTLDSMIYFDIYRTIVNLELTYIE